LKAKLLTILAVAVFVFSSVMMAQAQTENSIWRDEMTYQSADQLQVAGWTITHQAGVSFSGGAIILDGTQEDTAIHYSQHFSSGISNWRVEDRSRWTLGSHCGNSVTAVTDKHSYTFMADGWYSTYALYRDGQKTTFGSFQENKNEWFTLSIEKQGNQINMYHNGEIKSTYTETDNAASQLIGVDAVSPWRGGSEYDYFEVWQIGDTSTPEAQQSLLSNPLVIGGIIGAVGVGVGGVLYFFVLGGGGGAAGSAAGSTGAVGSTGGSQGGGGPGSGGEETPMLHPAGGGTLIHPSSSLQNTQPSTLHEVAMTPSEFSNEMLSSPLVTYGQSQSDLQAQQNQQLNIQGEQNAANTDRLRLQQNLQDQVIKIDQNIHNNRINTQNKINQQTNQLLQGSNEPSGEVADSGGSSGES
jgi:hypothetical protein